MKITNPKLLVLLAVLAVLLLLVGYFRFFQAGTETLWNISKGGEWLLPLVFVAALIDSINPCAFSVLILTIAFLFSLGKNSWQIFKIGGVYILGIFAAYILIGLGILQALHLFGVPHFMAKVGASILIAWGALGILNGLFPKFPIRLHIPRAAHAKMAVLMEKGSLPASFLLGGLVGLCEFPCTGGPYLMVLGLLHDQASYWKGVAYLFFYNGLFILPLALLLLVASERSLLKRVEVWKKEKTRELRLWGGAAMVILGIIVFIL